MYTAVATIPILLACVLSCVWATPYAAVGESKLLQAMRSTSNLQAQSNPSISLACFQYYSEVFDQLLQQYETEFKQCQNVSQQQTAQLDGVYQQQLSTLNNNTVSSCQVMIECSQQSDSLDSLACYSSVGGDNMRVMYNISSTAGIYYDDLKQRMEQIQFNESQCTNTSQRNYELNTDQAYINLQGCLSGNQAVPSIVSTTTQSSTDSSTNTDTNTATSTETTLAATTEVISSTPNYVIIKPTTSSAPSPNNSLSSELKKLLNSLRH